MAYPSSAKEKTSSSSSAVSIPVSKDIDAVTISPVWSKNSSSKVPRESATFSQNIQQNYQELFPNVLQLIQQKISIASLYGSQYKDPAGQIKALMSAFGDSEWMIGNILQDFKGTELPASMRDLIARIRALQSMIFANIRNTTGLNLSDDEFRALLESSPEKTQQLIPINQFLKEHLTDADRVSNQQLAHELDENQDTNLDSDLSDQLATDKNRYIDDEHIFGIQTNPAKHKALLASANQKVGKELETIIRQASGLISQAEAASNSVNAIELFRQAATVLSRGMQIGAVTKALQGMPSAQPGGASYDQPMQRIQELLGRLLKAFQGQNVTQNISPNISKNNSFSLN